MHFQNWNLKYDGIIVSIISGNGSIDLYIFYIYAMNVFTVDVS